MNHTTFYIFDLDGTVVYGNSSFAFFFYLIRKRRFPAYSFVSALYFWVLFHLGGISLREFHRRVFSVFVQGRTRDFFEGEVEEFLDKWLERNVDSKLLRGKDGKRALLSSSPDFLVGPIARRLGIEEWMGSEYGVDKGGIFCEISKIVDGEEKLRWVEKKVLGERVFAYSDSHHDLPLLERADDVCVVRPSWSLKRVARKRGWPLC